MKSSKSTDFKLNILVAYPYFAEEMIKVLESKDPNDYRLIVDSGAFSAYNMGMEIKLEEYEEFLINLRKRIPNFEAVQLDVVFNHEETEKNLAITRDKGILVNPVYTRGAPVDYLDKLIEDDEYIFVGGVQGGSGAREFAKFCLEKTPNSKVHYLAFVRPEFLKYYQPYSTDSSSWAGAARFGNLTLVKGHGRFKTVNKFDFQTRPSEENMNLLTNLGFTVQDIKRLGYAASWKSDGKFHLDNLLQGDKGGIKTFAAFVNICSHIKNSYLYEKKVGTLIFQAQANWQYLEAFFQAKKFLEIRGAYAR
jgi:hypothetical protein